MSDDQPLLRDMLAAIAYRGGKVLRDAPAGFGKTRIRRDTRSAVEVLAHINDVLRSGEPECKAIMFGQSSRLVSGAIRLIASSTNLDESTRP